MRHPNFTQEEQKVMQFSESYSQVLFKKAGKCSCRVLWDKDDYLLEAGRQLKDEWKHLLTCHL